MASLTIRNIPEDAKRRFRQLAAAHGRSMEEHLRRLIIEHGGEDLPRAARVEDKRLPFAHAGHGGMGTPDHDDDWVSELVRIASGAGDGVFDPEPQPLREFDL